MTSRTPSRPFHAPRAGRDLLLAGIAPAPTRRADPAALSHPIAPGRRAALTGATRRAALTGAALRAAPTGPTAAPTALTAAPTAAIGDAGAASADIGRVEALDLVRLLAILGMMAAHLLAPLALMGADGWQGAAARVASVLSEGTSSTVFAVIGGCSLVLASRGRMLAGDRRGAVLSGVVRGAVVLGIGLVLGFVPTSVIVVLVPFGAGMMLAAPLLLVRSRHLVALAAVLTAGGGLVNALVRERLEVVQEVGAITPLQLAEPGVLLRGLALTGMYPLVTWLPYLLLGIVLMRSLLAAIARGTARRWSLRALWTGAAAAAAAYGISALAGAWAVASGIDAQLVALHGFGAPVVAEPWALAVAAPHTGSPADMVATASVAVALLGLLTLVVPPGTHLTGRIGRALRAAGAAPLTVYTGHVVLTGIALIAAMLLHPEGELTAMPWYVAGVGVLAVHVALALGLGALLAATGRRGPLEAAVSGIVRRAVPRR